MAMGLVVSVDGETVGGVRGARAAPAGAHSARLVLGLMDHGESSQFLAACPRHRVLTSIPRTSWWGSVSARGGCPGSDWPGWTTGDWSTAAPWTTWSGCSASTTGSTVYTTTISGSATRTTSYEFQVAAASEGSSSGSGNPSITGVAATATSSGAAVKKDAAIGGAVAALMGVVALL
jgi:hypothetical protein